MAMSTKQAPLDVETVVIAGVDGQAPLVYMWEVIESGAVRCRYIGETKDPEKRLLGSYRRRVRSLQREDDRQGRPYGQMHVCLLNAMNADHRIRLTLLANADTKGERLDIEEEMQGKYGVICGCGYPVGTRLRVSEALRYVR